MNQKILNRTFGVLVVLAGAVILLESLSDLLYELSKGRFPSAWPFLAFAGASLIIVAGGITIVLTTVLRKPEFLGRYSFRTHETMFGRVLTGIFAVDSFLMGLLLLLLGGSDLYGPASDLNPYLQWRAIVMLGIGLILLPVGLVIMVRATPSVVGLVLLLVGTAILINGINDLLMVLAEVEPDGFPCFPIVTIVGGLATAVCGAIIQLRTKKSRDQLSILGSLK